MSGSDCHCSVPLSVCDEEETVLMLLCVCLQLDDLRRLSEMNGASANMSREELRESSLRIESLTAQMAAMQKEVGILFYIYLFCS